MGGLGKSANFLEPSQNHEALEHRGTKETFKSPGSFIMQVRRLSPREGRALDGEGTGCSWQSHSFNQAAEAPPATSYVTSKPVIGGARSQKHCAIPSNCGRILSWDHPLPTLGPPSDSVLPGSLLAPGLLLGRKPFRREMSKARREPRLPSLSGNLGFLVLATTLGHM